MRMYVVDAFTDRVFSGNQAAVVVLEEFLTPVLMTDIAVENNFSETAFVVKEGEAYHLRWFTPAGEIDFCGHATLATAWTLLHFYEQDAHSVRLITQAGELTVSRRGDYLEMDFPAYEVKPVPVTKEMEEAVGAKVLEAYLDRDLLLVLGSEEEVRNLSPDQDKLLALPGLLQCVTAPGKKVDAVSRMFAPKLAIFEDPVTGSTHCMVAPYWSERLGKKRLTFYQASKRGGSLEAEVKGERVAILGQAVLYSVGDILE